MAEWYLSNYYWKERRESPRRNEWKKKISEPRMNSRDVWFLIISNLISPKTLSLIILSSFFDPHYRLYSIDSLSDSSIIYVLLIVDVICKEVYSWIDNERQNALLSQFRMQGTITSHSGCWRLTAVFGLFILKCFYQ